MSETTIFCGRKKRLLFLKIFIVPYKHLQSCRLITSLRQDFNKYFIFRDPDNERTNPNFDILVDLNRNNVFYNPFDILSIVFDVQNEG